MVPWRVLGTIGCLLVSSAPGWAQSVNLKETLNAGDCFHVQLDMKLTGEMRVQKQGDWVNLKMDASAIHDLQERIMTLNAGGLAEKDVRLYDKATATISINGDKTEKNLRSERKLIVAQRQRDGLLAYSPTGPLTRPEVEVTSDHFDLLALAGILPGKEVAIGDTWKVTNSAAQGICNFEGLTEHDLVGKLEEVKDDIARFKITGTASGIDMGALVKMSVTALGEFDLKTKRLVKLDWNQKDEREAGPINPATKVQLHTLVKREPIDQPTSLSDPALVSVPDDGNKPPPANMTQLDLHDPKGRFDLLYNREWQVVSQNDTRLIMRMMERGDFVCQVTITPWSTAEKGKHLDPQEFKAQMNRTPGWELEKELQSGEVPSQTKGRYLYRLSMLGTLDGVPVLQNFYMVATPDGEQIVVAFTMSPKQVDKLGARDLALVDSLEVPGMHK